MSNRPLRKIPQASHPLWTGIAAGLIAGFVAGQSDRVLDKLVSTHQKRQDRRIREGSAHEMAGPYFARKITGKKLDRKEEEAARTVFNLAYGIGWGMVYAGLRKKYPGVARLGGLPFAIPFFFACDGTLAPLFGVSPGLQRLPWQPSAKEMGNHIAWTVAAEMVHRLVAGFSRK